MGILLVRILLLYRSYFYKVYFRLFYKEYKFREHNTAMIGKKKGNVDSDIIFQIMKKMYKKEDFDKIILVSGDGDYKLVVDFLIEENKLEKVLFPNRKYASSLYKKLGSAYFDYLDSTDIKGKIGIKKEKGSLGS